MNAILAIDFVRADGQVELTRVLDALQISKLQFAQASGLSKDTVAKKERLESSKTQRRLRDVVEIIARVSAWAGSLHQAYAWYRAQPIPSFGDRTAEDMVKAGEAELVKAYLSRIAAGGYA